MLVSKSSGKTPIASTVHMAASSGGDDWIKMSGLSHVNIEEPTPPIYGGGGGGADIREALHCGSGRRLYHDRV